MKKALCLFFLLLISCKVVFAQEASIIFNSDTKIRVKVNQPIDGNYNQNYVHSEWELSPENSIEHTIDINDFGFVCCEFSNNKKKYIIYLEKGGKVVIHNKEGRVSIDGDNAKGIAYYNHEQATKTLKNIFDLVGSIMDRNINDTINFDQIQQDINQELLLPIATELDRLYKLGEITKKCSTHIQATLSLEYKDAQFSLFSNLNYGRFKGYKPTEEESAIIANQIRSLFRKALLGDCLILKYPDNLILTDLFFLEYKLANESVRKQIEETHDTEIFGKRIVYFTAPECIQLFLFGKDLITQLQRKINYFDTEKLLLYLKEKYPKSEYIPIIESILEEQKNTEISKDIFWLKGDSITTLEQLADLPELKGKQLYIDLWATWCTPCKVQFKHEKVLQQLLESYDHILPVYIFQ